MKNRYYQGPVSDHFDGSRFFHPGLPASDKSLLQVLRWRLLGKRTRWPQIVPAMEGVKPEKRVEHLRITFVGHASLLVQVAGCNILVDPVWAARASPLSRFGPRRRNAPAIAFSDLPPINIVLVTHNHYDHMDLAFLERLWARDQPRLVSSLGNDGVIQATAPKVPVLTGDWWDEVPLFHGITATIVPAYHWSSRHLADRRMALWSGFFLRTAYGSLYCAGDTAYRDGRIFHEIRERLASPDLAILPIGAYAPRWFMETQHVNPEEAIQIALDCGAKQVLGIHWGTFQLTDEPYLEPEERFYAAAREAGFAAGTVRALRPGDVYQVRNEDAI